METSHAQLVSHSGEYLRVCPLSKDQRKFTECTRERRQEDKLDSKSDYPRVYIHTVGHTMGGDMTLCFIVLTVANYH